MNYDKYQDMINRAIDGLLSPEEQAALEEYLEKNPGAAEEYQNLKKSAEILNNISQVPPPSDLKENILAGIRSNRSRSDSGPGYLRRLANHFRTGEIGRFGFVYAAGIVTGIAIFFISLSLSDSAGKWNFDGASGALIEQEIAQRDWKDISINEIEVGGARGVVTTGKSGSNILLNLKLTSPAETETGLEFSNSDIYLAGFWPGDSISGYLIAENKYLRFSTGGNVEYSFLFVDSVQSVKNLVLDIESMGEIKKIIFSADNRDN